VGKDAPRGCRCQNVVQGPSIRIPCSGLSELETGNAISTICVGAYIFHGESRDPRTGFDYNGFASGTSVETAHIQLGKMGMIITNEDTTRHGLSLVAVDKNAQEKRLTVLNFCSERLYQGMCGLFDSDRTLYQFLLMV
jgi:hypothetical protein